MYTKRARGAYAMPNPIFYQDPPKFGFMDGKMEKKVYEKNGK